MTTDGLRHFLKKARVAAVVRVLDIAPENKDDDYGAMVELVGAVRDLANGKCVWRKGGALEITSAQDILE